MTQRSAIIPLLRQEEGVRYTPYLDSLGYPTTGVGFKLGPQGASIKNYTFRLSDTTIDAWLSDTVSGVQAGMRKNSEISIALAHCNQPRQDILTSMAYQMGVAGLSGFHQMLDAISAEEWDEAVAQMLNSSWAKQTPSRAQRQSAVLKSGLWQPTYSF
ncbi:glycoside hydrolase family protein [Yokenella regensburgei]|uniref:glycoside hydrolase family protein n=1 Tax=Yokenella regensburgei TaxID=158877 RepID=UPI0013760203|nr:glycoside hydrolase family protein [Yokenella regensburgei]KAF1367774.1 lysozyme [Yokenella regensburgei]